MKILHLIHTPRHSGAEMLVRDLCLAHAAEPGVQSAVAAFAPTEEAFAPELQRLREAGVAIYAPNAPVGRLGRLKIYGDAIRDFAPDVVIAHSAIPGIYGRLALMATGSRTRIVLVLHSASDDYAGGPLSWAERALAFRTDHVVAVSPGAAERYSRRGLGGKAPISVILNGVDLKRFLDARAARDTARASLGLAAPDRLLLQVGRLSPVKQQRFTLSAVADLVKADPSVRLWFAGIVEDAAYAEQFQADVAALNLGDRVRFLGPRMDVPELLAASDVYLMPSRSEAHSIAFLEAMASGPPIIVSDIPAFAFARGMEGVDHTPLGDQAAFRDRVAARLAAPRRFTHDLTPYDMVETAKSYRRLAESLTHPTRPDRA